jgi:general secretion pathway protein K
MAELLRQRAAETAARVPETSGLQSRDGAPRRCAIGDDFNVEIRVFDEAGKIDINTAGPELVERFLSRVLPRDAASARFARQLIERRSAEAKRENPSSGGPATAKGSRSKPFGTTFELGRLPGATPDLLERSLPFVTVHSGLAGIDAEFAALDLLRSLADGENGRGSRAAIARSMPATYLTSSPKNVFLIRATADSAAGATHRAEAIIEIASPATPSIKTLEWREPHVDPSVPTPAFVRVAAC